MEATVIMIGKVTGGLPTFVYTPVLYCIVHIILGINLGHWKWELLVKLHQPMLLEMRIYGYIDRSAAACTQHWNNIETTLHLRSININMLSQQCMNTAQVLHACGAESKNYTFTNNSRTPMTSNSPLEGIDIFTCNRFIGLILDPPVGKFSEDNLNQLYSKQAWGSLVSCYSTPLTMNQ